MTGGSTDAPRRRSLRAVGLDLGSVRIGVAASDAGGVLASPRTIVRRSGDHARDHAALGALVAEEGADVVVVGLPLSLDGSVGRAAQLVLDELDALRAALGVPVVTHDERFSTTTAHQRLAATGRRSRARREIVDQSAAAVLLQAWLDGPACAAMAAAPSDDHRSAVPLPGASVTIARRPPTPSERGRS